MAKQVDHGKSYAWYIDYGASCHFTNRHNWSVNNDTYVSSVVFGGGDEFIIEGK